MQERLERPGVDRGDRLGLGQQPLLERVHREAHRGLRGPLRAPGLEHEQAPLLDRELGVLHVLVVGLELAQDLGQLIGHLRHPIAQLGEIAWRAHPRDHVLALRVGQKVARRRRRAGHLVAAERHARTRRLALVAVHHLLHVDRGTPIIGQPVDPPVLDGALAHPRIEHRLGSPASTAPAGRSGSRRTT